MVNIVTTLGEGSSEPWPIARPIIASFTLLIVSIALAYYTFTPTWPIIIRYLSPDSDSNRPLGNSSPQVSKSAFQRRLSKLVHQIPHLGFCLSIFVLIVYVTIAALTNASVLFAAFIAGGMVSFLWKLQPEEERDNVGDGDERVEEASKMFHDYFRPLTEYILVPFFFVSLWSIPYIFKVFHMVAEAL